MPDEGERVVALLQCGSRGGWGRRRGRDGGCGCGGNDDCDVGGGRGCDGAGDWPVSKRRGRAEGFGAYVVAGVTVVRKYEEQSAVPCRVGKAEALTARRPVDC